MREVAAEPRLSLLRFSRKLRWALGDEEITDTRNLAFYRERLAPLRLPLVGFGAVSFLGLTGAALLARERAARFLLLFALFYLVSLSLFFVYGRYRLPLLVPFSILAGAGIARACRLVADRRAGEILPVLPVAVLAFWLSFAKVLPGTGESFFVDYFNRGNHLLAGGDLDAAIREFEQALWVRPGNHPATRTAILRLADLYVLRGNPAAAEDLLQRARAAGRLSFPDRTGPR